MTTLKTECRKFAPNIFNKTKCQNCFRTKDAHSAEALESNRATRKVSKCGYLFVAPDWDFSLTINRTKRWQRRWFVLYDDGELTYSVDEHPDTVPQAVIDMNKVLEVSDAEDVTGNQFAVAITAPEKVHFVKGTSKEESKWWFDVLSRFPRNTVRGKHKRNATFPGGKATSTASTDNVTSEESNKESTTSVSRTRFLSANTDSTNKNRKDWWHQVDRPDEDVFPTKENGSYIIENVKSSTPIDRGKSVQVGENRDLNSEMVTTENVNNVLNKLISTSTSSVPVNNNKTIISSSTSKRDNLKNGVDVLHDDISSRDRIQMSETPELKEGRSRRYLKRESRGRKSQRSRSDGVAKMIPPYSGKDTEGFGVWPHIDISHNPSTKTYHHNPVYLLLSDAPSMKRYESLESLKTDSSSPLLPRRRHTSEKEGVVRCISFSEKREFPHRDKGLKKSGSLVNIALDSLDWRSHTNSIPNENATKTSSPFYRGNQQVPEGSVKQSTIFSMKPVRDTDVEPQIRGSTEIIENISSCVNSGLELNQEEPFVKKGWLMRQNLTKEWYKHWFVLRNTSLTYYRDPTAEDSGILDGVLDLGQVTSVEELELDRNYVFSLTMWDNKKYVLSAVTAGIRNNWIQAIRHAATLCDTTPRKELPGEKLPHVDKCSCTECKNGIKGSLPSSPVQSHREPEKLIDISSSDDQSEYFSIVDEEETVDRASSPRALPPSPPLNRTPMSLVKERARSRTSNSMISRQCGSCGNGGSTQHSSDHQSDETASDHSEVYVADSPVWDRKKYKECSNRLLDAQWKQDGLKDQSDRKREEISCSTKHSLEKISRINSDIEKHNSQIELLELRCKELEEKLVVKEKEIGEKFSELDSLRSVKASYLDLVEKHNSLRKKLQDYCKPSSGTTSDENYRLKYELLKNKYLREKAEWESKLKKEKLHNSSSSCKEGRDSSVEDFLRIVQKSKDQLNEMRDRLQSSEEKSEDSWFLWKEVAKLCEEAEKISPSVDKRTKKDVELKKLKKSISELQSLCSNRQHKLEDEQKKLITLYSSLDSKENEVKQIRKELEQSREKNVNLSNKVKQLESAIFVDVSLDSSSTVDCDVLLSRNAQLKARLEMAKEEIKRLKKELKEAHASYDDLEIHCITLKQESKNADEVHKSQLALMTARVDDLTCKLTVSERNLRQVKQRLLKVEAKQERRKSSLKNKESLSLSKEYEAKLAELEQKITSIETSAKEVKQYRSGDAGTNSEVEDNAPEKQQQKRSSLDSSSSENTSLLLRLHTLGVRVQAATEAVEKHSQVQKEKDEEEESLDKPKICLQVKSDEDCSLQEEGEDWSTLSFTTSMTDLQAIDADDNEFPCSVGDCLDCLGQKVEGLLSWLRTALQLLQRQEHGTFVGPVKTSSSFVHDGNYLANLIDVLEYLSESKMEEAFDPAGSEKVVAASLFYKLLLLYEASRILHRISSGESIRVYDHLSIVSSAVNILCNHLSYIQDSINDGTSQNSTAIIDVVSVVNSLSSICNDLNIKDSSVVANQNTGENALQSNLVDSVKHFQVQCTHMLEMFNEIKELKFSAIWQALTETPVQDSEGRFRHQSAAGICDDDLKEIANKEPLLSSITQVVTQVFQIGESQLFFADQHLNSLSHKSEALTSWNSIVKDTLITEMTSLLEELKKHCPQDSEAGAFLSAFNETEHQNVLPSVAELARASVSRAIVQSVIIFLRDGLKETLEDTDISKIDSNIVDKVSSACSPYIHEELYQCMLNFAKDGVMSFVHNSKSTTKKLEKLSLESALNVAMLQIQHAKELERTQSFYRKKIEWLQSELKFSQKEQEEYRKESCCSCAELQKDVNHLQKDLDAMIASQRSCKCEELRNELHSVVDDHQRELCAIEEHHQQEVENTRKQMQNMIDHKERIHSEEVKKLEDQIQMAQKKLKHLEIEYDEQIQSLCELCEQKLAHKQDPINEEAIRRRYQAEIEQLKCLCEKGLVAMENSHRRIILELEQRHKNELAQLEAEKEKVLAEETQATITALEVMRKAHEEELRQEIAKFKDEFIRRMQMDHTETFQREQETELGEIKHEILSLSEKYSVKCLETASLAERLEALSHQLQEANHQLFDLLARNKQLQVHLAIDIEQKREALEGKETAQSAEELQQLLKLRESELTEQREENAQLRQNLHVAQMHVSMLDVQCQQLDQSLKAERRLREDEVSSLRTRLDAIILASSASEESGENPPRNDADSGSRGRTSLYRSPSLTLSRRFHELRPHRGILSASRTRELMRSPSCPGLDGGQISSSW